MFKPNDTIAYLSLSVILLSVSCVADNDESVGMIGSRLCCDFLRSEFCVCSVNSLLLAPLFSVIDVVSPPDFMEEFVNLKKEN